MKNVLALFFFASVAMAQGLPPTLHSGPPGGEASGRAHEIPFPGGTSVSKENVIELSVSNSSNVTVEHVKVEVTNAPDWLKFISKIETLPELKPEQEQIATFSFSVENTVPLNYELYQNYPNLFNPTTMIEYQLPGVETRFIVSLKAYDILRREVAHLVTRQQEAGYYRKTFDAHRYASGVYIYQLIATDEQNNKHVFRKKMVLLR